MPHPTASQLYISRTVGAINTKFYRHTQAELSYISTGYEITSCFRSEDTAKKRRKYRLRRLQVEFLENVLSEDHQSSQAYRVPLVP